MKKRDYSFDNLKFILIILVVFGHLIEICSNYGRESNVYKIIYSFHMPLMIFISGFFAKFNKKKILNFTILYIVFQLLYTVFLKYGLKSDVDIQLFKPEWLMWFLLVSVYYMILIPLVKVNFNNGNLKRNYIKIFVILTLSVLISLFIPYIKKIGYYLSLSRFFAFLPYFLLGFYIRKYIEFKGENNIIKQERKLFFKVLFGILTLTSVILVILLVNVNAYHFMGSFGYYSKYPSNPFVKLFSMFCAISWIGFLTYTLKINRKLPVISRIGQNTLVIYLLHGFIIKLLEHFNIFEKYQVNLLFILLFAISIVLLLGNVVFEYFSKYILYGGIFKTKKNE